MSAFRFRNVDLLNSRKTTALLSGKINSVGTLNRRGLIIAAVKEFIFLFVRDETGQVNDLDARLIGTLIKIRIVNQ